MSATQLEPDPIAELVSAALTGWSLTNTDRRLVEHAAHTFGSDWRYLLDMVQAANRTSRGKRVT